MRLAPEGTTQILLSTLVVGLGVCAAIVWYWPLAVPLVVLWGWTVSFFRDPARKADLRRDELCAPADGTVKDIARLNRDRDLGGPVIRVGIFLSLFDVHINRSPCAGTVRSVVYRPGKFLAAMRARAAELNESNTVVIDRPVMPAAPVVVRQVAGVAARRIVCHARPGTNLFAGERFGMIKFGSRTELVVPLIKGTEVLVEVGDRVKAGVTPVVRQSLRDRQNRNTAHEEHGEVEAGHPAVPA